MPVRRAAGSADELALLRTVVADLSADTPLRIYADWLDSKGDPRGAFLREFLTAFDARRPLPPDPTDLNPAWADILGLTIRRRMRTDYSRSHDEYVRYAAQTYTPNGFAALEPYLGDILRSPKVVISLGIGAPQPLGTFLLGTSRAGGCPDLPPGSVWPMAEDAQFGGRWPLQFLLQIDLSEVRGTLADGLLPPAGLLTLFRWLGHVFEQGLPLVWYTPPGVELTRLVPPTPYKWHDQSCGDREFPATVTHPVRLSESLDFPFPIPGIPEATEPSDDPNRPSTLKYVLLQNAIEGYTSGRKHVMCGSAEKEFCWVLPDYFEQRAYFIAGANPAPEEPYLELFELRLEEGLIWYFGDGDRLHVHVPAEPARRGDFGLAITSEL